MKKRILVVEDKLPNLVNAHHATQERGYEADLASDLVTANALLAENTYDGIITDMCFEEKGVRLEDESYLSKLPVIKQLAYLGTASKRRETSDELRKAVIEESLKVLENANLEYKAFHSDGLNLKSEVLSSSYRPALGYFLAKESEVPLTIVSSAGHAQNSLPAIIATGLVSADELVAYAQGEFELNEQFYKNPNDVKELYNSSVQRDIFETEMVWGKYRYCWIKETLESFDDSDKVKEFKKKLSENPYTSHLASLNPREIPAKLGFLGGDEFQRKDVSEEEGKMLDRLFNLGIRMDYSTEITDTYKSGIEEKITSATVGGGYQGLPFIGSNVIIANMKTPGVYNLAIDQLEGKIDQTRPYALERKLS